MKRLLMLSAKYADIPLVNAAKSMGYYVISTGNKENQPVHRYSDEYIPFNYMDREGLVELAESLKIDAICQGCTDACALTASYVGEKLGLKGHDSYTNALIIHQKDEFKKFARQYNIMTPKTEWYDTLDEALDFPCDYEYPLIVKPADLGGGQGISVAYNKEEFEKAIRKAFEKSIIGHIVVEPFIEGTLHSMSTFIVNGKVAAYGTANDYSYINKYLTNTGSFPALGYESTSPILLKEVEKIAEILGLVDGLLHFQYIVDKNGIPWIIEMMRRIPGNNFLIALSNSVGINWYEWIIRAESGGNCKYIPRNTEPKMFYAYHSSMASQNGIYRGVTISKNIADHIFHEEKLMEKGEMIQDYLTEKVMNFQLGFFSEKEKNDFILNINELIKVDVE